MTVRLNVIKVYRFFVPLLVTVLLIQSCRKDEENENLALNKEILEIMEEIYLWWEHVPRVDVSIYNSPQDLMYDLRYKPLDRWSVVWTKDEYDQYFKQGEMIGHGFLLGTDNSNRIRVAFVYASTKAYEAGVRRSWIINKLNDVYVNQNNINELLGRKEIGIRNKFEFINPLGETVTIYLTKESLDITAILHYEILNIENMNIGYMVFQDFIETALPDIDETFTTFKNNNIDELIIDLRYNGGGSISVAEYIASWIAGNSMAGEAFIKLLHNAKYVRFDTVINITYNENSLDLDRIFFIGTSATASASELLINGFKPLAGVFLTGDNTYGKPVGMYTFMYSDYNYTVLPVCFRFTNSNDEGDFYDGLIPDSYAEDDLTKDFGDPEEGCLEECLNLIITGIPSSPVQKSTGKEYLIEMESPINAFLRAY
jgi:carboxyl-terminal processing protease